MSASELTFCMLKTEAILFRWEPYIRRRLAEEGFEVVGEWRVRPSVRDIFAMYPGWVARLAILLRMPYLFGSRVIWLRRRDGIRTMHQTKHRLRREIWGWLAARGGYLHAPDSPEELRAHKRILQRSCVRVGGFDPELGAKEGRPIRAWG